MSNFKEIELLKAELLTEIHYLLINSIDFDVTFQNTELQVSAIIIIYWENVPAEKMQHLMENRNYKLNLDNYIFKQFVQSF